MSEYVVGSKRTCIMCGKEFVIKNWNQQCCSRECRVAYKRKWNRERPRKTEDKVCIMCGKTFRTANPDAKYCSQACYFRHKAIEYGHEAKPKRALIQITQEIPIFKHLQPEVGKAYAADIGGEKIPFYVIHRPDGMHIIVHQDECIVLKTE